MTTPEAAARYLKNHLAEYSGRPTAVFNPHGKPVEELPVIYGFNNGGGRDWWHAELLAEDGTHLGGHVCSAEGYMYADLGVIEGARPDRHETFQKHYPDGYRMAFVTRSEVKEHEGLKLAFMRNQAMADTEKENAND